MPSNDADLKAYRELFADDSAEWHEIRREGTLDMRYASGDPWDARDRLAREQAGRPCLTLDEIGQYTNQVTNDVRANKRAVKFAPVGNGANDKTAQFYANKWREVEYRSKAQIGYTIAFDNAVNRSYGFVRVATRYESARAVNQDLWIDPVHNPDLVTPDAGALMPDMSDQRHCWVREPWRIDDANRRWPDAKIEKGSRGHSDLIREYATWITANQVWIAEHWKIRTRRRKLLIVQPAAAPPSNGNGQPAQPADPIGVFEDEFDGQGQVLDTRPVDDPSVYQCLTNGVEILEETPWPGKYIPIVACLGKVIYLDDGVGARRKILSMIRLARDPFMAYCFYRTCEIENVGMTTKNPYWAYEGQLSPAQMIAIARSMHEPVAVLTASPTTEKTGTQLLPLPVRNVNEPYIQGLSVGAEEMRRAIQAAMGQSPLPTMAQRRNEKSGVALKQIEETGQRGSFHFTDHYLDMIAQVGRIGEDLMDKIYDTPRSVGIRLPNDEAKVIRINDPRAQESVSTKGDHLVTVSSGPSFESERTAGSEFADTIVASPVLQLVGPEKAPKLISAAIRLKNLGAIGDEMADIIDPKAQGDGPPDPAQLQAALQEAGAKLQQLEQIATQMKQALDTEQAKQAATVEKARIDAEAKQAQTDADNAFKLKIATMDNATKIRVAEISAATKGYADEAAHAAAHEALALEQVHEISQAEQARQFDVEMAERGHAQALETGDQGIAGQLAVTAAQPQPEQAEGSV